MYSRRDENFNMNRSYGRSINDDLTQQRNFVTTNKSGEQPMNCTNTDSKLDFSIFHGQSSSVQTKPVQLSELQKQSFKDLGDTSHSKQQSYVKRENFGQSERFQQNSSRNGSAFAKSKTPEVFHGNTRALRPCTPVPCKDWQEQAHSTMNTDDVHSDATANTSSNGFGFTGVSKSKTQISSSSSLNMSKMEETNQGPGKSTSRVKRYGNSDGEKMCVLTGTVERIIKWGKIFQNHFCYFEVIAAVLSIADGKVQFEKIMLLRDRRGPILQVIYYSNATHLNIEDFHLGQLLRIVGRMTGPNIMSAITIRAATNEEVENFPRMYYVSDLVVSTLCSSN